MSKKLTPKIVRELIRQPLEGLLYDLDLLPEQLKEGTRDYLLGLVITELRNTKDAWVQAGKYTPDRFEKKSAGYAEAREKLIQLGEIE